MFIKSLLAGSAIAAGGVGLVAAQQSSPQGNTQRDAAGQTPSEQSPSGQTTSGQAPVNPTASDPTNAWGGRSQQMGHSLEREITDCLVHGNQAEITLARIAEQRASDPEVKQFAQKMIKEHTAFLDKLQTGRGTPAGRQFGDQSPVQGRSAVGGEANRDQPNRDQSVRDQLNGGQANGGQPNGDQPAVGGPGVDVNAPGARVRVGRDETRSGAVGHDGRSQAGGARQFLQIQKEVQAQCLQSMTRELSQKEGVQFDRCYMNCQVGAHMKMADELTVYSKHVSENLQATLQEGLQATTQHLAMAKQIAERLDGGTTARAAARNQNTQGQ
jgi:predicted outer membrane protein